MRSLKRREQSISILAPTITTGSMGSKIVTWAGMAESSKADVQPMSSDAAVSEYGLRVDKMMLAIVPSTTECEIGWGVWLAGESNVLPPWLIVSKERWLNLTNLTIEKRV